MTTTLAPSTALAYACTAIASNLLPLDSDAPELTTTYYAMRQDGHGDYFATTSQDVHPRGLLLIAQYLRRSGYTGVRMIASCDGDVIWSEVAPLI